MPCRVSVKTLWVTLYLICSVTILVLTCYFSVYRYLTTLLGELKIHIHNIISVVYSEGGDSPRTELLHNIDLLTPPQGSPRPGSKFDTRIAAAIRVDSWKLITGNPGISVIYIIYVYAVTTRRTKSYHSAACNRWAKYLPVHARTAPFGKTYFKRKE